MASHVTMEPAPGAQPEAASAAEAAAIHREIDLAASPERVYETLLDAESFAAFSGASAHIDRTEGGVFRVIGGRVTGRNIELIPNQRIVQAWRLEGWPAGVYSTVRIELRPNGSGTRVALRHTGFPSGHRDALIAGWPKYYWDPMRKYLAWLSNFTRRMC